MKIVIEEQPGLSEIQVTIRCGHCDSQVRRLLAALQGFDQKITGGREGQTFLLEPEEVFYIDTVDKKTFLYTERAVYETPLRLYELEERLSASDFIRAGKSVLVNFGRVQSLCPEFGGKLRLTLQNGEVLLVSRQYVQQVREKLGLPEKRRVLP